MHDAGFTTSRHAGSISGRRENRSSSSQGRSVAIVAVWACLLGLAPSPSAAQPAISLLKDLYPGTATTLSSGASEFAALGSEVIFRACDSEHGCELWKTNGTAAGTVLVADLWRGEGSGYPTGFVPSGTRVFFRTCDGFQGTSLWVTDGTRAGTKMLLYGSAGFYSYLYVNLDLGSQVLSGLDDLVAVSNSTLAVSVLLAGAPPYSAARIGGTVLFSTRDVPGNLYRTDGTAAGTQVVTTIPNSPWIPPHQLTSVGSKVLFAAYTMPGHGRELWVSDGTPGGTMEVKDIRTGSSSSNPSQLTAVGATLYFTANDGANGVELWKSDGTELGTTMVKDINPGSASSSPTDLVAIGSTLYFVATDGATGREVWKSDGNPAGTVPVADLMPGTNGSSPSGLVAFGSSLVFYGNDGVHGLEPWISDGTAAGTHMIADFNPDSGDGVGAALPARVVGASLYLAIDDGATGFDPWVSDGTAAGSSRIADLALGPGDGRLPSYETQSAMLAGGSEIVSLGDWAVFVGFDPATGWELWRTDGTPAGTTLLADIRPGALSSSPQRLTQVGNRVFFFANDGTHGKEAWVTDGTPLGTGLVADLAAADLGVMPEYQHASPFFRGPSAVALSSRFLFEADAGSGRHLWSSDGTAAGTADLTAITSPDADTGIGILGGMAYFNGDGGLWRTDGTPGGTLLAVPDSATINFSSVTEGPKMAAGQRLYFDAAADLGSGLNVALVTTDGTVAGTEALLDNADTEYRTALGDRVMFAHRDGSHGYEPWITDGTPAGTALLADVMPGLSSSAPQSFTQLHGELFFAADDGTHGVELWKTDGTGPGTELFLDLAAGAEASSPRCLTEISGFLYFAAYRPSEGAELWRTDGTGPGTELVGDLATGAASSSPCGFVRVGHKVVFTAWDALYGRELRVIDDVGQDLIFKDGFE
jgi:ELWxxDGT repeat protein